MIPFTHHRTFWQRWLEILGLLHPELTSNYFPGWTRDLPPIDAKPFDAAPRKRGKKLRVVK